jgi:hypothetical protein
MLTKEISEVEKGCKRYLREEYIGTSIGDVKTDIFCGKWELDNMRFSDYCPICQAKLSILKSAQAKFDKFLKDLKQGFPNKFEMGNGQKLANMIFNDWLDELSSKQEGKC